MKLALIFTSMLSMVISLNASGVFYEKHDKISNSENHLYKRISTSNFNRMKRSSRTTQLFTQRRCFRWCIRDQQAEWVYPKACGDLRKVKFRNACIGCRFNRKCSGSTQFFTVH